MFILSDLHIYILVISADSLIMSRQQISVSLKDTAASVLWFIFLVSQLPFNPGIRMDRGQPLTTYLCILCV